MTTGSRGFIGGLEILPPLSVEDERALHAIIQEGRSAGAQIARNDVTDAARRRQLLRARQKGQEAESLLLRATFGLVRVRVLERGYRFYNDDLEAAGVEGLINALRRFDPSQGNRFATYANYWIVKLVNQTVQQQAGLSDAEMRLILKFQRFQRSHLDRRLTKKEVAQELGISQVKAQEIMQLSRELQSRRFASAELEDVADPRPTGEINEAPAWVIDELRRLTGDDFDAFWQYTFKTMAMEEIARSYGISRQGMSKRIERSRRAVKESPEADRLQRWFDQQ
ncbi:MAG: polymerase, sigma 70 subunit, RpoD subfamily [Acidimicrobiaceae bacterium]|nr:polymerase, sigma 70 subunit, RpoD subfamily [Acidimicrobiaceae bacterium]